MSSTALLYENSKDPKKVEKGHIMMQLGVSEHAVDVSLFLQPDFFCLSYLDYLAN